jgi:hypothetical protein
MSAALPVAVSLAERDWLAQATPLIWESSDVRAAFAVSFRAAFEEESRCTS